MRETSPTGSLVIASEARLPLSVAVISLNAAGSIGACLDSVAFADDIVVIDSGSDDATADIARERNARVIVHSWRGFGPQKQFAVESSHHDWVLCIDTDELVSAELQQSIRRALQKPAYKAYAMPRRNRFMGRWLTHGEGYPDWSLRLFDRRHAQWSDDAVHEKILTTEQRGKLAGDLLHDSAEDLHTYLLKQNHYTSLQAETLWRQNTPAPALSLALSPVTRFVKFYLLRRGFLDGLPGLVHIVVGCFNSFIKYAKLRELQRKRGTA